MGNVTTIEQAIKAGEIDGVDHVEEIARNEGVEAATKWLKPGCLGLDEGAINNATHRIAGVPEEFKQAYYEAYDRASRARAEEMRGEAA